MGNIFTCSSSLKLSNDLVVELNADSSGVEVKLLDALAHRSLYSSKDKKQLDNAVKKYISRRIDSQIPDEPPKLVRQNAVSQL